MSISVKSPMTCVRRLSSALAIAVGVSLIVLAFIAESVVGRADVYTLLEQRLVTQRLQVGLVDERVYLVALLGIDVLNFERSV